MFLGKSSSFWFEPEKKHVFQELRTKGIAGFVADHRIYPTLGTERGVVIVNPSSDFRYREYGLTIETSRIPAVPDFFPVSAGMGMRDFALSFCHLHSVHLMLGPTRGE